MPTNPNPNISDLDPGQIPNRVFDEENDAIRTTVASETQFSVELSRDDGDSVYDYAPQNATSGTLLSTASPNDVVIATFSVVGYNTGTIYANTLTGVSALGTVKVQISPSDSVEVWADHLTFNTGAAPSVVTKATLDLAIARRMRVIVDTAPTGGNADIYLIAGRY